jgi:hypothetical protein
MLKCYCSSAFAKKTTNFIERVKLLLRIFFFLKKLQKLNMIFDEQVRKSWLDIEKRVKRGWRNKSSFSIYNGPPNVKSYYFL